jgi:hypothetical protein
LTLGVLVAYGVCVGMFGLLRMQHFVPFSTLRVKAKAEHFVPFSTLGVEPEADSVRD